MPVDIQMMQTIAKSLRSKYYYNAAKRIVEAGRVEHIADVVNKAGDIVVTGDVYTTYMTTRFHATVTIDTKHSLIRKKFTCTCKSRGKGICEHALAILTCYLNEWGVVGVPKPGYYSRKYTVEMSESLPVETSPEISQLITSYAERSQTKALEVTDAAAEQEGLPEGEDSVELLCMLKPLFTGRQPRISDFELKLKIMRGNRVYAVQNIAKIIDARTTGETLRYGKYLEFPHWRRSFSKGANAILDFIETTCKKHSADRYGSGSYHMPSYYELPRREMRLSVPEAFELLDLIDGSRIIYETRGIQTPPEGFPLRQGTPEISAELREGRSGSYELELKPGDYAPVVGQGRLYLIGHGRALRCPDDFAEDLGDLCATLLPMSKPLYIQDKDMLSFCTVVLPKLREYLDVDEPASVNAFAPPKPKFRFSIALTGSMISCEAKVTYDDTTLLLFEQPRKGHPMRDIERELHAQHTVRTYFPEGYLKTPDYAHPVAPDVTVWYGRYDTYSYESMSKTPIKPFFSVYNDDAYFLLFSEGLGALAEIGEVLLSENLNRVEVRRPPQIHIEATVDAGLLDLEVTSTDMTPEELIEYLSSFKRHQRFIRLTDGDIMRLDDSLVAVSQLADGLGLELADLLDGAHGISTNRTLYIDAMLKRAEGVRFDRDRNFRRIVRDFDTIADADYTAPDGLDEVLRPYQDEGFKWLTTLGRLGFGGILADDMGLGKTLELISYLAFQKSEGEERPSLVVCPASLVYNWRSEANRFAPSLDVVCLTGTKTERRKAIQEASEHDLLVTSYDLLRRDVEELCQVRFSCVALDEAQYVKNAQTLAAKAARTLTSDVRFALTGTPIENRLLELWSIFDFLMPSMLGSAQAFTKRFANPINGGSTEAAANLRALVSPFILRRNKRDVLKDLPDKNETIVYASMEGEQDKLYRASAERLILSLQNQLPEEFAVSRIKVLAELTKLRQICCDPHLIYENYKGHSAKLDTCMELIRQAIEGGHKMLVFSQFTSMLELIEARLKKEKVGWLKLTGATSKEERVRLVDKFQTGETPVFLISLKAGGTGLNLTAADVVIHYDPWWNVAAENQATDRTHRIGQTREVSVFKIIAKDTIEEKIQKMQEAKRDLAESVLGGEATSSSAISREDLLALLDAGLSDQ